MNHLWHARLTRLSAICTGSCRVGHCRASQLLVGGAVSCLSPPTCQCAQIAELQGSKQCVALTFPAPRYPVMSVTGTGAWASADESTKTGSRPAAAPPATAWPPSRASWSSADMAQSGQWLGHDVVLRFSFGPPFSYPSSSMGSGTSSSLSAIEGQMLEQQQPKAPGI